MSLKENKGSILIMSMIVFFIISFISITTSSIILSNSRIGSLEKESEIIKQENIGTIEIICSNVLNKVKDIKEKTETEEEFYKCITADKGKDFINSSKLIEDSKNRTVEMGYNEAISTKKYFYYKILVRYNIANHNKCSLIKLKIENPWYGIKKEKSKDKDKKDKDSEKKEDSSKEITHEKKDIKINDLITFYNYEEI